MYQIIYVYNFEFSRNIKLKIVGCSVLDVLNKLYQNFSILHFDSVSLGYLPVSPSSIHGGVVTFTSNSN